MKKTIVLLDDDIGVRLAIARALEFAGFEVMPFSSGQDLLARISEVLHQADGQVGFLLDMRMPGGVSGLEVMRRLRERGIAHPVVFLSGEAHLQEAIEALKAGASDFLLKPVDHEKLVQALRCALDAVAIEQDQPDEEESDAPIDLGTVFAGFQGQTEEPEGPGSEGFAALTRREQEVLSFVLKGFRSLQIASALQISERTVKMHRSNIMAKVGAHGATHLVYLYQQFRRGHSRVA